MPNFLSPLLRPIGLDPSQGYDTAAAGAKAAQGQANALSDLQWNRQMQGLGQAQGYVQNLQSLYNSLYSPGGGQQAPGGAPVVTPPMGAAPGSGSAMASLTPPPGPSVVGQSASGWRGPASGPIQGTPTPPTNWRGR